VIRVNPRPIRDNPRPIRVIRVNPRDPRQSASIRVRSA
jgi:hypothetical protein